jgi:hypothetical protein
VWRRREPAKSGKAMIGGDGFRPEAIALRPKPGVQARRLLSRGGPVAEASVPWPHVRRSIVLAEPAEKGHLARRWKTLEMHDG